MVKYRLEPTAGSLKDDNLFRRFFICMNFESREMSSINNKQENRSNVGVYLQFGIVQGYDSIETIKLAYFDQEPLDVRYYMFGRLEKFSFRVNFILFIMFILDNS